LTGAHADHRPKDFRFSRTQREAGIAHLPWDTRLSPPLRPVAYYAIATLCWVIFLTMAVWTSIG